jgi:ABC-type multidrug transport system fused ATPase/permease subunit
VSSGEVTVDGVKVSEADLTELRSRFAIVPQTAFADTVAAIAYGAERDQDEIEQAARRFRTISSWPCRRRPATAGERA